MQPGSAFTASRLLEARSPPPNSVGVYCLAQNLAISRRGSYLSTPKHRRADTDRREMRSKAKCNVAESKGFEPLEPFGSTVFKTAAIDHSASSPPGILAQPF